MKKTVFAMSMAAALCFTSAGVMAEETVSSSEAAAVEEQEVQEFSWDQYEAMAEQMGYAGEFYVFDEYGFEMWIPEAYTQIEELDEEAQEKGYLDAYVTEDGESQITVRYQNYGEDVTFDDILANAEGQYDNYVKCIVNDMDMLFLNCDDGETVNIFLGMTDGAYLQFAYINLDTPERKIASGFSQMSIRLLEDEENAE